MSTRYRGLVHDSARWEGFETRPGDVFVCTPPKCGTTWMQMIVLLLVFQQPELPDRLASIAPWLDMVARPRTEVFAELAAQEHRRSVKSHTPLDGLPQEDQATYVVVGRDPRDAGISMDHHRANLDFDRFFADRVHAAAVDGVELEPLSPPAPASDDPAERFWRWVEDDTDPTTTAHSLRFTMAHLRSFWEAPEHLDVVFFHYDDLQVDLAGEMRRLAEHLGIEVPDDRWPGLVDAATFDSMRNRAVDVAPGQSAALWRDPDRFFHRGTSGQWRELLDEEGVERYARRVRSLAPPDLVEWLHRADPLPE